MGRGSEWTTPSELAEYTFCPRAAFYRRTETAPRTAASEGGVAYHARELDGERWRDEHRLAPWLTLAVGAILFAIAVVLVVH